MDIAQIQGAAKKRCTQTVVYKKGSIERYAAALAMLGRTDRAIQRKTGLTLHQSGYRARKAKIKRTGEDAFREGRSKFSQDVERIALKLAYKHIDEKVAPLFLPYADSRINQ